MSYFTVFKMRLRMELQYRGAMIGGILCQMFFGLILVALYRALYAGKPQSVPIENVAIYVWLQQAFFRMMLASDSELVDKIRSGDISYDLCRPVNMYGFYYARIMAQKLMGSLMRAVPMLVMAFVLPRGWGVSLPESGLGLLAAVPALFLGLLCVCALENITVAFTMITLDPRGMQGLLNLLMLTLSGNLLPLTLFPESWQKIITFFPYAQLLDAPIRLYTGEYAPGDAFRVYVLQSFWVVVLIGLGVSMWNANRKRMIVQGG
ncbi:ABC transporter permease [Butyrivibrio sp. YAB3001]|uniref:ABC transporter permease n=1 Tax=Butyrivibrio sp. YAB3001 TaxID=1520812 RepID=UPI0008F63153|nr:ABC-2 family transporter protein [Butyrivibrio sp. YAB3001]SFB99804.1 ABC-2 type transport system permease protein [Butyrivibrio sp. YAB3001]